MFFKSVHALFFSLTHSLIGRCQIVTDTCKNNVSKFVWKPFKSPLSLPKWKCFGEAICITSILTTIYSPKNCSVYLAVLTALNHPGSFGKNFVKFKKNINIHVSFIGQGSVRMVKNCDLRPRAAFSTPQKSFSTPRSQFFTIRTDPYPTNNIYLFRLQSNSSGRYNLFIAEHLFGCYCLISTHLNLPRPLNRIFIHFNS